jgi:hypothetical protein
MLTLSAAFDTGVFNDDEAATVKGLDDLGGGRVYATPTQSNSRHVTAGQDISRPAATAQGYSRHATIAQGNFRNASNEQGNFRNATNGQGISRKNKTRDDVKVLLEHSNRRLVIHLELFGRRRC